MKPVWGLLAVVCGAAAAGELEFKGLALGSAPEQALARFPAFECRKSPGYIEGDVRCEAPGFRPDIECDNPLKPWPKNVEECTYQDARRGWCRRDPAWQAAARAVCGSLAELRAVGSIRLDKVELAYFDDRLGRVDLRFSSYSYTTMRAALTAKFGEPTHRTTRVLQGGGGQLHNAERLIWVMPSGSVLVDEIYIRARDARVVYLADEFAEEYKRRAARDGAGAASDL